MGISRAVCDYIQGVNEVEIQVKYWGRMFVILHSNEKHKIWCFCVSVDWNKNFELVLQFRQFI